MAKMVYNNVANRFEATTDDGQYFVSIHADEYESICNEAVEAGNSEQEVDTAEFWTDKEHQEWSDTIICNDVRDLDTRDEDEQAELEEDAALNDLQAEIEQEDAEYNRMTRRMGRPRAEDRKEPQQVLLEPAYIDYIKAKAKARGMTASALMREMIIGVIHADRQFMSQFAPKMRKPQ